MSHRPVSPTQLAVTLVLVLCIFGLFPRHGDAVSSATTSPDVVLQTSPKSLVEGATLYSGSGGAPFQLVEFFDYQCPPCRGMHSQIAQLTKQYDGRLSVYLRNWPLPFHPAARPCARASEAAKRLGNFQAFHDEMMRGHEDFSPEHFAAAARLADIRVSDLKRLSASPEVAEAVKADEKLAKKLGLTGTPSFVLIAHGQKCILLSSLSHLSTYISG